MYNSDLRPIFYFAVFGMVCAGVAICAGIPYGLWWAFHHVSFH